MMFGATVGQLARVHYKRSVACSLAGVYHGRTGRIVVVGRRKPRNYGVVFDDCPGELVIVPCGNLVRADGAGPRRSADVLPNVAKATTGGSE